MPKNLKRHIGQRDLHFITFCCYQRRALLGSVRARNVFVKILGEVRGRFQVSLLGYVVMPEHVHLLINEPPGTPPSKIVQVLKQRVSRSLRARKRPHCVNQFALRFPGDPAGLRRFWQRRYFDFNVWSERKQREKLQYMHANPVTARLVTHPRDWLWGSWRWYADADGVLLAMDVPQAKLDQSDARKSK